MTDAKVDFESLLGDYDGFEAGMRRIKLNHHKSTNEERASESSPMELCDIVTAVSIEDSSDEEYILDELRRLIQNRTAMSALCCSVLFGLMTSLGVMSFFINMNAQRNFLSIGFLGALLWALLLTVTMFLILFVERTLILNIFRASYKRRNIGNEFITHSILSFVDFKIVTGMVVGVCLNW
eukprot:CAMPEP_0198304244 /NCGR_PEP_ID=MMETSP1449-20131203/57294_1 /TAXON_ID=420275 /ORGANISM="Attheya septentrionalis, Strain CCMP2084" /LENGTH=180 /DNA_ID=CAMNT_0044006759 /DNA_START=92 /DNA_END=631 /DNA_ORIENTATION=-